MSFDPFKQKVKPVSEAFESWKELFVKPYDKDHVDPYTRLRIILMNGTEFDRINFRGTAGTTIFAASWRW